MAELYTTSLFNTPNGATYESFANLDDWTQVNSGGTINPSFLGGTLTFTASGNGDNYNTYKHNTLISSIDFSYEARIGLGVSEGSGTRYMRFGFKQSTGYYFFQYRSGSVPDSGLHLFYTSDSGQILSTAVIGAQVDVRIRFIANYVYFDYKLASSSVWLNHYYIARPAGDLELIIGSYIYENATLTTIGSITKYDPPERRPVLYYRFEGNSNDAMEAANGTDTNIAYAENYGKYGQGCHFNGESSFINLGNNASLVTTKSFVFWVKTPAAFVSGYICRKGYESANSLNYSVAITSQGYLEYREVGAFGYSHRTTNALSANTQYFIIITCYKNATTPIIYINNEAVELTFTGFSGGYQGAPNSSNLYLGSNQADSCSKEYLLGSIDDLAIFDRIIAPAERAELFQSNPSIFIPKIIFF